MIIFIFNYSPHFLKYYFVIAKELYSPWKTQKNLDKRSCPYHFTKLLARRCIFLGDP